MTYRIVAAPKLASQYEFDCQVCEHESLKHPVFLEGPAGRFAAGTGCAAKLLYGDDSARSKRLVRATFDTEMFKAKQAAELAAERQTRYTAALAAFQKGKEARANGLDVAVDSLGDVPALISARTTYSNWRERFESTPPLNFPEFMAAIAETGEIPEMAA